jgi:hydroxymethylpyrimidine pyrophosphatase-like HAD family hydrolase
LEKYLDAAAANAVLRVLKSYVKSGKFMTSANPSVHPLETVQEVSDNLRYLYLLQLDEQVSISIANHINTEKSAVAHLTPSWYGTGHFDLHITHPNATKEHAIKVWQRREGISHNQTIGMGDSGNDIPIFMSSGLKVAVANATPDLLELADYIAPSASQHALEHVIGKFLVT